MNKELLLGIVYFFVGQVLVWYQSNSQFVWDWWKDKPVITALIYSIPISLLFWYGTKHIYDSTSQLWTARFLGFGMGYLTFPILTYYYLNESMFTTKTLLCTALAVMILLIQVFWK